MAAKITQYVIKIHSRCDLACDHCYVYEHADQSWRLKPTAINMDVLERAANRITEHVRAHGITDVHVILHGGEPLLLGHRRLEEVLRLLRARISPWVRLDLRIHTNGVRLDERFCELFTEYGVMVGVSLDGDRASNDLHRRFRDGRTSHPQVLRALSLLRRPEYRRLYSGLLCTVDLRNDPIAVYEALLAEEPPRIDLLLPHATWDRPPPRPDGVEAPYADWLEEIHRRWVDDGHPVPIRLFDSLRSASRGGRSESEAVGLGAVDLLVIETNGDWEQADSLKTAFDGAPATAMNVRDHTVDEAAAHPAICARSGGLDALCATCRSCPVVRICGGGLYAHRYGRGRAFDNPSVFCADLKQLIAQVKGTVPRPQPVLRHALPPGAFEAFAAGYGSVPGIKALADMRLSVSRALVAAVAAEPNRGDARLTDGTKAGWELLCELDTTHPEAVRKVLAHPFTQAWAIRCLRPPEAADVALDRAHLVSLAAAAALRAGLHSPLNELPLPVRNGTVHLPTLGTLIVDPGLGERTVRLSPDDLGAERWQKVRRLGEVGPSIEDLDPFRDCQAWKVTGRLTLSEWQTWSQAVSAAIALLEKELPGYARVVDAGLQAIVPLYPDRARTHLAATARQAFGAVALGLHTDPQELSALIVHEFQHVKLYALMDLYDLVDPAYDGHLRVPWHPLPRPAEGVLHGIYAHLAVVELWRVRTGGQAHEHFLRYRSWVEEAMGSLTAAGALTHDGDRFVAGLQATINQW